LPKLLHENVTCYTEGFSHFVTSMTAPVRMTSLRWLSGIRGLKQYHGLASWRDKRLIAGIDWDEEIRSRLEDMDIFLFIASATSLLRPYIKDPELKRARERRAAGEIEIVSVMLEPCAYDADPFLRRLQRLGSRERSIAETSLKAGAWEQVRRDFLPVIQRVRDKKKPLGTSIA
jgi:hypothetical protein